MTNSKHRNHIRRRCTRVATCNSQCFDGYGKNATGKCEKCTSECVLCSSNNTVCTKCVDTAHLRADGSCGASPSCGKKCLQCGSQTKVNSGALKCMKCQNGYALSNGKCTVKCTRANCVSCSASNPQRCTLCDYDYETDSYGTTTSGKCAKCPDGCFKCKTSTKCTEVSARRVSDRCPGMR